MSARYTGGLVYNAPGGWSGYFDGSGDNLTVSSSAGVTGTGAFTVEFWVYMTATQSFSRPISGGADQFTIDLSSDGVINYGKAGVNNIISSNVGALLNTWRHIVIARSSGGTARMWANGISVGTATDSNNYTAGTVYIGSTSVPSFYLTGYLSNVRITNTDVYGTSNTTITVPTGALLPVSGTSLLTCAYPTFRDGSSNNFTITVTGNTAVSNVNPFPTSQLPNPALGGAGNGVYTMTQYAALKAANLWPAYDPYYKNVTLNLHGNGTNAAQNNTFLDSSTNNFTITRNGNTTQGTFTPYGSNWSNYFDGSGDYLSTPGNAAFDFGSGNFTVEAWLYRTTSGGFTVIGDVQYWYAFSLRVNSSGAVFSYGFSSATSSQIWYCTSANNIVPVDAWCHLALVRNGSSIIVYANGVNVASTTPTGSAGTTSSVRIAHNDAGVEGTGYVSNARIVKGTAVYTANFTPSTTPLTAITNTSLLTCQSNRFIDNSTNNFTITKNGDTSVQRFSPFSPTTAYSTSVIGGSGYFDGSGDYLSVPTASAVAFGTGDFTVEMWIYATASGVYVPFDSRGGGTGFCFYTNGATINVAVGGATNWFTGASINLNSWVHIAVTRASSTARLFVNGALVSSGTQTTNFGNNTTYIGQDSFGASQYWPGYMNDVRVIKGTAVYTSAFTPPTAPLTAITNTQLLLSYTNAGILDNAMMNDLETVGNAQISTSVKKYGTGSMYFDGTGDRLTTASSPNIAFGTGDFTVEAWVYTNVLVGERGFIQTSATVGGLQTSYTNGVISTVAAGAGSYTFNCNIAGTNIGGSVPVTTGTWYHVAFTRSSGSVRLFINGTLAGGPTTITANLDGQNVCIGGYYNTSYLWNGYIDDLRITKGVARYTASFTPPTSQVQDQ